MTTRVNIIYVGGTVRRLLPFLHSILVYTQWPLNLVVNGCADDEVEMLSTIARVHPERVEIVNVSADEVLAHGVVLDRLLEREPSPFFCTLDSDIFASGPVALEELLPGPDQVATCSCVPIWHRTEDLEMPEGHLIAAGRFIRMGESEFLGCSYAMAYRTEELRNVVSKYGISMRTYRWAELPPGAQANLRQRNLQLRIYDTTKVANLLLQSPDRRMEYVEIPNLIHLGGQSSAENHGNGRADTTLLHRVRALAGRRMPWLIAAVWRVRGLSAAESASLGDLAHRRFRAEKFLEEVGAGTKSFGEAPEWLADERTFDAITAVLTAPHADQRS